MIVAPIVEVFSISQYLSSMFEITPDYPQTAHRQPPTSTFSQSIWTSSSMHLYSHPHNEILTPLIQQIKIIFNTWHCSDISHFVLHWHHIYYVRNTLVVSARIYCAISVGIYQVMSTLPIVSVSLASDFKLEHRPILSEIHTLYK